MTLETYLLAALRSLQVEAKITQVKNKNQQTDNNNNRVKKCLCSIKQEKAV